jgi:YD repeat-containing protein
MTFGELGQFVKCADPNGGIPYTGFNYTQTWVNTGYVWLVTAKTDQISSSVLTNTAYQYNSSNKYVLSIAIVDNGGLSLTSSFAFDAVGNLTAVDGPRTDVSDVWTYGWDSNRRLTQSVEPQNNNGFTVTTAYTYDRDGLVTLTTHGGPQAQNTTAFVYDVVGNKTQTSTLNLPWTNVFAVTQTSYDGADRPLCTVVRMNANNLATPPSNPCAQDALTPAGPDRITRNTYDAAGQLVMAERGVGANSPAGSNDTVTFAQYTYTPNGKRKTLLDAASNLSTYAYDDFDRLSQLTYPSPNRGTSTSDTGAYYTSSNGDFEAFTYDADGNRLSFRRRNGQTITYTYDALDRMSSKTVPTGPSTSLQTSYTYDLLNRMLSATYPGGASNGIVFTYDNAGRKTGENQ